MTSHPLTIKSDRITNVLSCDIIVRIPGADDGVTLHGIWDTGASASVITTKAVQALGLAPVSHKLIHASGNSQIRYVYLVDIMLHNGVIIEGLSVTDTDSLGDQADALIGMDIINLGDFSITNCKGKTCMSFRVPSLHEIDYSENMNLIVKPPKKNLERILNTKGQKRVKNRR